MNILEGLFFGSQVPFDEVDMNCPDYFRAGDKVCECRANILKQYPDITQLMEEY